MIVPSTPQAAPPKPGGHLHEPVYCGQTRLRDYGAREAVFINETHWNVFARNGAGKMATHGAFVSMFNAAGGGLFISPKSHEWPDFGLQRRCDPTLWERYPSRGRGLGVHPFETTETPRVRPNWYVPNGRCFLLAPENNSHLLQTSSWNPLFDCGIMPGVSWSPQSWSRLVAVCGASFPAADPGSNRDPIWWQSPTAGLSAAAAFLLMTDPDPAHHCMSYVVRWFLGYDENPERFGYKTDAEGNRTKQLNVEVGSPKMQRMHFVEMAKATSLLDGQVAMAGNAFLQLGEKMYGSVNGEIQAKANWYADPRYASVMSQSDFSMEEVGADPEFPVTVYVSPVAAEGDSPESFLRTVYGLAALIFLKRPFRPQHPVWMVGDEIAQWSRGLSREVLLLHTYGRSQNVRCLNYWQAPSQAETSLGADGFQTVASNSAQVFFGGADATARRYLRERLGAATLRKRRGLLGRVASEREVDILSADAIDRDLNMGSSLAYVLPSSSRPLVTRRCAVKGIRTPEGARYEGLPGARGHYTEF